MTGRTYPLPRPESDPRFTFGLVFDVAKVLEDHGFPPVSSGSDLVELMGAIFGFVYAAEKPPAPTTSVEDRTSPTFVEYRDAIPHWQGRLAEAEAAGDTARADRCRHCVELLLERVTRAEVIAQRGEWHVDVSDEALAALASHAGSGVAR